MELKEIDPWDVTVSDLNERQVGESDPEFVENVREMGLIQPPIVRTLNGEGVDARIGAEYAAVVGGRRVDAAQQADLDIIPVVVMDEWDDGEALAASISENIDAFRKDVSRQDRAVAIQRLMELEGLLQREVAERLGVVQKTVSDWLEYTRDEWEGTSIDPTFQPAPDESDRTEGSVQPVDGDEGKHELHLNQDVEDLSTKTVQKVRRMTGGGEEGERILQEVAESGLGDASMEEVNQRVNRGQDVEEAIQQVKQGQNNEGGISVHTRVVFTGRHAEAIENAAKDRGASDDQIVRVAVENWLDREGYL